MGNANVNLGGFGFDFSEDGGGVTLFGLRVGGGKNGAEVGVNVGVGAKIDGSGVYAGTGGKVTVGGNGVGASAGAQAAFVNEGAGAAASARANFDGSTYAKAVATTAALIRDREVNLKDAKKDLTQFQMNLKSSEQELTVVKIAFENAKKVLGDTEDILKQKETAFKKAGGKKTELLNIQTDLEIVLVNESSEVDRRGHQLRRSDRRNADKQNNYVVEQKSRQKIIDELNDQISENEKALTLAIDELTLAIDEAKKAGEELCQAARDKINAAKQCDTRGEELHKIEAHYKEFKSLVKKSETNVRKQKDRLDEAQKYYKDEKEKEDAYLASF